MKELKFYALKHRLVLLMVFGLFILANEKTYSQGVSVNASGNPPDNSAGLDVNFNDKGILIPRLTSSQRDSINTPAEGLMIYNLDCHTYNYYNGSTWGSFITASVNITASPAGPICSGTSVTFTATPVNGGISPAYQWVVNGTNAGTNNNSYSYTPGMGDIISCVMVPNTCISGASVTSNTITMIVNPNAPATSVSINDNPSGAITPGTNVVFTASAVNGGTTPSYQWTLDGDNVGSNDSVYSNSSLNNGDNVNCVVTSSATCATGSPATSNIIAITVLNYEIFTSGGTFTPVNGVTTYNVLVVGGGGNGGVAQLQNGGGGGGGGGASGLVAVGTYTVTSPLVVTVGSAGNASAFGGFLTSAAGNSGQPGSNTGCPIYGGSGGSGGGAGQRSGGYGGGDGGSGGSNGGNPQCSGSCGAGGTGQGSYASSLSLFTQSSITAGTGGSGDTYGSVCSTANNLMNGTGGSGYGGGGGGGSDDTQEVNAHGGGGGGGGILINGAGPAVGAGTGNAYTNGGAGASGVVYVEW